MTGQELIKFYDGVINPALLSNQCESIRMENHPILGLSPELEQQLDRVVFDYTTTFPALTRNWTYDIEAFYYRSHSAVVVGPKVASDQPGQEAARATLIVLGSDTRFLDFPRQGIQIDGRPGRAVMFPSQWTHMFQLVGEGDVLEVTYRIGDTRWEDAKRPQRHQDRMITV